MPASDMTKKLDFYWKVFSGIVGILIVPLVGWIWTTNVEVTQIKSDLADAEEVVVTLEAKIEEAENNSRAIISIEKDIEYMKDSLSRIEQLVTSK